jgi:hypothetical protein
MHLPTMHRIFSLLLLIGMAGPASLLAKDPDENDLLTAVRLSQQQRFRQKVDSIRQTLPAWLRQHGFNEHTAIIADLSLHSGLPRMLVLDLASGKITDSGMVAHGSGGNSYAEEARFSNEPNSYCSSLGKYKIGAAYTGRFGLAFKLHGLETSNNNAFRRAVVLHGHDCVPEASNFPDMICNSLGCPTVSPSFLKRLEKMLRASAKPMLLWIIN